MILVQYFVRESVPVEKDEMRKNISKWTADGPIYINYKGGIYWAENTRVRTTTIPERGYKLRDDLNDQTMIKFFKGKNIRNKWRKMRLWTEGKKRKKKKAKSKTRGQNGSLIWSDGTVSKWAASIWIMGRDLRQWEEIMEDTVFIVY